MPGQCRAIALGPVGCEFGPGVCPGHELARVIPDILLAPLAETINGLYKAELIRRRGPWKNRESVELTTLEWVHWFNHIRLLKPIGGIPPAEAEANYWKQRSAASTSTEVST